MIVPDDTPGSPLKQNPEHPPAYQYTGYTNVPVNAPAGPSTQRPLTLPTTTTPLWLKERRRTAGSAACRRFSKAFLCAAFIYFLAAAFFGSISWGRNLKGSDWQYWGSGDPEWPDYTNGNGWELAQDGCSVPWTDGDIDFPFLSLPGIEIDWPAPFPRMRIEIPDGPGINLEDFPDLPEVIIGDPEKIDAPYKSHTTLMLSPEAVKHLIVGNRAYGTIQFVTSSDTKDIKVDVVAYYHRQYVFDKVRVCKLRGKDGGEGVGIYMPIRRGTWRREDQVTFKVVVTFPTSKSPLVINSFETYLSIFTHHLHELKDRLFFRNLKLRSSNTRLQVDSVEASVMDLRTSNGGISGKFYVNNSLVLDTSNGRIDVDLDLEDEGRKAGGVDVTLRSSNAAVQANAHLFAQLGDKESSTYKSDRGGRFSIDARTSNGRLTLNVPTIPSEAVVKLNGRSSNSPVDIQLDRKGSFEGVFKAYTSSYMGVPIVERADEGSDDKHRRVLETRHAGKGSNEGRVYWDEWKGTDGVVEARTSNSKVSLSI